MSVWTEAFQQAVAQTPSAMLMLALCALVFFALAVGVKGLGAALTSGKAAGEDTRVNAILSGIDQFTVTPLLNGINVVVTSALAGAIGVSLHALAAQAGWRLDIAAVWASLGPAPTVAATVFVGDFFGYWRHRLQHSRWLWPAHAVHHSDTTLTWFSLERMHPIDRIGSLCDSLLLAALGIPPWALIVNVNVRHFYGYLVHADVPWTLGKANWLFNSPAMHRWHHARDPKAYDSNFATVFSVFDRLFGTYYQPGPCDAPLGVDFDMGRGVVGQYLYPLKVWFGIGKQAPVWSAAEVTGEGDSLSPGRA